jgi:hypothetical protein
MDATRPAGRRILPTRGYAIAGLVLFAVPLALLMVNWRQLGPASASLTFDATADKFGTISVDGMTDLPDGTHLSWQVRRGPYSQPDPGAPHLRHGEVTVSDGGFLATIDELPSATGTVMSIGVRFYPVDDQPPATVARFGPEGEHLRGPGVVDDSGTPVLLVIREVVIQSLLPTAQP